MPTRRRHRGGNGKNHRMQVRTVMKQMTTSSPAVQQPHTRAAWTRTHSRLRRRPLGWERSTHQTFSLSIHPLWPLSAPVLPLLPPPPSPRGSPDPLAGTVMVVVPNTREAGVFHAKARTIYFLDVPFTMEPKVHFTLEVTAGFNIAHDSGLTGSSNSQSSA